MSERDKFLAGLKDWLGSSSGPPPALADFGMAAEADAMRRMVAEEQRRRGLERLRGAVEQDENLRNPSPWQGEALIRSRYSGYGGPDTGAGDQMNFTPSGWGTVRGFVPNPEATRDRGFVRPLRRRTYEKI